MTHEGCNCIFDLQVKNKRNYKSIFTWLGRDYKALPAIKH